jgi:hypothetical protein
MFWRQAIAGWRATFGGCVKDETVSVTCRNLVIIVIVVVDVVVVVVVVGRCLIHKN